MSNSIDFKVEISGFDVFKQTLAIVNQMLDDERIPVTVREEYEAKFENLIKEVE